MSTKMYLVNEFKRWRKLWENGGFWWFARVFCRRLQKCKNYINFFGTKGTCINPIKLFTYQKFCKK